MKLRYSIPDWKITKGAVLCTIALINALVDGPVCRGAETLRSAEPVTPVSLPDAFRDALMAEEVRQDLSAAIRGYESVVRTADEQRSLVATSVYRLGECYRKLGRTNDAVAQFRRILAEFSGEKQLSELSRQNLAALGISPGSNPAFPQTKGVPGDLSHDAELNQLSKQLADTERKQTQLRTTYAENHPELVRNTQVLAILRKQIDARKQVLLNGQTLLQGRKQGSFQVDRELLRLLKAMGATEVASSVLENLTQDAELIRLSTQIAMGNDELAKLNSDLSDEHPAVKKAVSALKTLKIQHRERFDALLSALSLVDDSGGRSSAGTDPDGEAELLEDEKRDLARLRKDLAESPDVALAGMKSRMEDAAAKGHVAMIRALLAAGFDVRANGEAAVRSAAGNGRKKALELLLDAGAPVVGRRNVTSALHLAAAGKKLEILKLLVDRGADVNARDENGNTPLLAAYSQKESRKLLLERGADLWATNRLGQTLLHAVLYSGDPEALEESLEWIRKSPNVHAQALMPAFSPGSKFQNIVAPPGDSTGYSRLIYNYLECALAYGRLEHARRLLKAGARYMEESGLGAMERSTSPLIHVKDRNLIVEVLKTAEPEMARAAAESLLWKMVNLVNSQDADGLPETLQLMIDQRLPMPADATAASMVATAISQLPPVDKQQQGLTRGAGPILPPPPTPIPPGNPGQTKSEEKLRENCFEVVKAFLNMGLNPNTPQNNHHNTPLEAAVLHGDEEMVKLLLAHGGDPEKGSAPDITPLRLALHRAGEQRMDGYQLVPVNIESNALCRALGRPFEAFVEKLKSTTRIQSGDRYHVPLSASAKAEMRTVATALNRIRKSGPSMARWNLNLIRVKKSSGGSAGAETLPPRWWTQEDCGWNKLLAGGDVVSVEASEGSESQARQTSTSTVNEVLRALEACSTVNVRIRRSINDEAERVRHTPRFRSPPPPGSQPLTIESTVVRSVECPRLQCFLESSKMVSSSSDLTKVKILRAQPQPGESTEMVVDATSSDGNSLELFDGDVIEVPQKP